jgi:Met-zincin/Domain of unknown function (DUF5117)
MKRNQFKFTKYLCVLIIIFGALDSQDSFAQRKKKKKKGEQEVVEKPEEKKEPKVKTIAELTVKDTKTDGLFTIYQDTTSGSVKIFIKEEQFGKEFIYQSFSMGGPAQLFLNQNMLRETWLFSVRKVYDRIEFVRSNTNYYYDPSNAVSKAANVDVSEAVFYSVKATGKDSTGILIPVDGLFLSQKLDAVKPVLPPGFPPNLMLNLGSLKKDKSGYSKLRSYPDNTDFVVNLAYENPAPRNRGDGAVTDARYVNVKMQHSFLEVPENDFKARADDPRVGYFMEQVTDLTSYTSTPYKDIIHRWNLVKKDPNAAISDPVEPITWWVENTTPVEWRNSILQAGRNWNAAFESAGFSNAVVMKMMPDDAEWDPADIRYNVIRWVSSNLGFAIGPSFVNPRTGQILGADITVDFGIMNGANNEAALFDALTSNANYMNQHALCQIGQGLKAQLGMATTVVDIYGSEADSDELKHQFMNFLIMHEMGHTMGLNHNMKASNMLSPAELADQKVTRAKGLTGSVMDYPSPNLIIQDAPIDYYTTKAGPYDHWAIEFGYRQFAEGEEEAGLKKILARSGESDLAFGNDADIVSPFGGVDPRVRTWDMSNDMVAYASGQYELVNNTMSKLKDKFVVDGESYHNLYARFNGLRSRRFGMTQGLVGYIGGIYVDRSFVGPDSGKNPMTPVSSEYQRSAMRAISKYLLAPDAFSADEQVYPYLQLQRRGFNFGGGGEDANVQANAAQVQGIVFGFVLSPVVMQRINNTSLYGNDYSLSEVVNDLVKAVFDADMNKNVNLYRQNAQTMLVNRLGGIVNDERRYDNASKSVAFASLNSLKAKLKRSTAGDAMTKAHRSHLVHIIDKAMDQD